MVLKLHGEAERLARQLAERSGQHADFLQPGHH